MKHVLTVLLALILTTPMAFAQEPASATQAQPQAESVVAQPLANQPQGAALQTEYLLGVDDVLDISILQPERMTVTVVVSPDGMITFPYIGTVLARGLSMAQLQQSVQDKLADGYMKYPVVSVSLKESRSRKFFVYGEVMKPGTYFINDNVTVLRGITMAGGFTRFGSSKVKILRPKQNKPGYDTVQVNIKALMDGAAKEDVLLEPEDIVVVSQGLF